MLNEDFVRDAIFAELKRRLDKMLDEQMAGFKNSIENAIRAEVGEIALSILSNYEMHRDAQNLVITVKRTPSPSHR